MSKSDIMRELAREKGWPIVELKLVDGGPEFEVLRTHEPAPTYEQAVVHMFRTAKGIIEVGEKLQIEVQIARHRYHHATHALHAYRQRSRIFKGTRNPRWSRVHFEGEVCQALDALWVAQEKYKAWAKTYGDL